MILLPMPGEVMGVFDSCHRHFTCIQQPLLHITWITMLGEYVVAAQEQTAIHFVWVVSVTLCHSSCREYIQGYSIDYSAIFSTCDIQSMHDSILCVVLSLSTALKNKSLGIV